MIDLTIKIAGAAGQGMQTIAFSVAKALTRQGYYVHCYQDLMSRIRGGHNFATLRISDRPVGCLAEKANILVALNAESVELHAGEMVEGGGVILDSKFSSPVVSAPLDDHARGKLNLFPVPLEGLAVEHGRNKIMLNSVASGACFGLMEYDIDVLADTLGDIFARKGDASVEANIRAARAGYDYTLKNFPKGACPYCRIDVRREKGEGKLLMTGSEAAGFGAMLGGVQFLSAYPMSPSTAILEYLAARQRDHGLIVEQAEDEIAAVNMAIGASAAGARAMTCTSGGGFALMAEGLSLAGMCEVPLVIFLAQRPGPATGFPTRTEQGDLMFALHGGHGEFARAILTPGDAGETVKAMALAFNLSDRYQTPIIVLGDQNLNDSYWTEDEIDVSSFSIDRGKVVDDWPDGSRDYKRYQITADGVSPRLVPGTPRAVGYWDSDEHTEEGHITESAATRRRMVAKRLTKLRGLGSEALEPVVSGSGTEMALVGFGSTKHAVREAAGWLCEHGVEAAAVHFPQAWPLPKGAGELLAGYHKLIVVEQNATGQFAGLLRSEIGLEPGGRINRFDGRPITAGYIVDSLNAL
jgi:2-oxoglutarate ferredoxin oxidoreductase subunit alpha